MKLSCEAAIICELLYMVGPEDPVATGEFHRVHGAPFCEIRCSQIRQSSKGANPNNNNSNT